MLRALPDRRTRWLALLFAVVIAAAYANSFGIGFHFDDWHTLQDNPFIRDWRNIPRFFVDANTTTVLRENKDLRPLLVTTFALNWTVSGAAPWSWHAVNVVLHWLVVLLVFRIVRDHLWLGEDGVPVGVAAALVVAAHPLNSEALDYLSARSALLTAVFYLAAFDAAVRRRDLAALLCFALALLTKMTAVTLPLAVVGYWLVARTRGRTPVPWRLLAGFGGIAVLGGSYRLWLLPPGTVANTHQADITPWAYFMTEWSAYLYYLRLFLWPNALVVDRVDYPVVHALGDPQAWASLGVLVLLGTLVWRARRRWPALAFAALWYFVTLAAESTFFPLAEPVNEHRPYLAMLGLGTAAALGLWGLTGVIARRRHAPHAWTFALVVAVVTCVLGAATFRRNETWKDDYVLWHDAIAKAPNNSRAWLNAGHAAMGRGNWAEARTLLLEARRLRACYSYVQINLSVVASHEDDPFGALRWADEAVHCEPGQALAHYYRALALEGVDQPAEALAEYRQTTAIDPQHSDAWFAAGRLLEARGDAVMAADAFDRAFATDPTRAEAAMRAGLLYHHALGDAALAIERYRSVLALVPTHYGAHYQIAVALLAVGRETEARAAWRDFVPLAEAIGDRRSLEDAPEMLRLTRK